ncbi:hypothetical protein F5890DRAFT_191750 [Lentinula detonsa]|uniref:Uncharacterized protein n=1 Tax=Lentinula detonsa TaxID=2804962 RepID=A0AA38PYC0_9AGAR|nr:hypothetical protein F5890DRAFT_191750 [Lentinula detonsa]
MESFNIASLHLGIRFFFLAIVLFLPMYFVGISWFTYVITLGPIIFLLICVQLSARTRVTYSYANLPGILAGFLLQFQDPRFALLAYYHSDIRQHFASYMVKIFMSTAVLIDDASEEKEQTVRWIHWLHRDLQSLKVTDGMQQRLDILKNIPTCGYDNHNEAYASLLDAITWTTLSLHERFGNS